MEGIEPYILSMQEIDSLRVIKDYGRKAAVTDACIITGCNFSSFSLHNPNVCDDDSLRGRIGPYALRNSDGEEIDVIGGYGIEVKESVYSTDYCVRIALKLSDELFNALVARSYKGHNNVSLVDFGFYPQYVPDWEIQKKYLKDSEYITTIANARKYDLGACNYEEIEYYGKRYVAARVNYRGRKYEKQRATYFKPATYVQVANTKNSERLSNDHVYKQGDICLLEISPVTWLIDYDTHMIISKNSLISGISYLETYQLNPDKFASTRIGTFIYESMLPNILQGEGLVNVKKRVEPINIAIPKPVAKEFDYKPMPKMKETSKQQEVIKQQPIVPTDLQATGFHEIASRSKISHLLNGTVSSTASKIETRLKNIEDQILILTYDLSENSIKTIKYFTARLNNLIDRYNNNFDTLNNFNQTETEDDSFDVFLTQLENDVCVAVASFYKELNEKENRFRV